MSRAREFLKLFEAKSLEDTVDNLLNDKGFNKVVPSMIDAAKQALVVAKTSKNIAMEKFNELALDFLDAIKSQDRDEAISSAKALVKAGHGEAFGL